MSAYELDNTLDSREMSELYNKWNHIIWQKIAMLQLYTDFLRFYKT